MKTIGEQTSPDLLKLQPVEQLGGQGITPLMPADCGDDAPC
ncbi:MAG: hypothetical protein ABFR63_00900 [Thermodesulfobacteriota bacterium]